MLMRLKLRTMNSKHYVLYACSINKSYDHSCSSFFFVCYIIKIYFKQEIILVLQKLKRFVHVISKASITIHSKKHETSIDRKVLNSDLNLFKCWSV